jgi:UDP-N-acetylmuramoyl-tripeptide--D-alanyl-D-alanine ligase
VASVWVVPVAFVTAIVTALAPLQLGIKGRTSPLAWTRRLRTLAGVTAAFVAAILLIAGAAAGVGAAAVAGAWLAVAIPVLVDLALYALKPVEDLLARRYVNRATVILQLVAPIVVAVTGSYGKTTTKGYIAHLLAAERDVLASPASYNNRAGLARTVNEHLRPGVQVLVAEMGTYGPGEIAAL